MNNLLGRAILPALNSCEGCGKPKNDHVNCDHEYRRDSRLPEWHGWHAARRGVGSNLYRLGVQDMVIQRILRHANVSTTATYYTKTAADDVRNAMTKLENTVPSTPKAPDILDTPVLRDTKYGFTSGPTFDQVTWDNGGTSHLAP